MTPVDLGDVRAIQHFAELPECDAERLASNVVERVYLPRQHIVREGDYSRGFYFLKSGRARIYRTGSDGREQILRLLGPGESFGEVPMLDQHPAPASVAALERSVVLFVPMWPVFELLHRQPCVAVGLLRHFAERLRSFTDLVCQISLQTVQSRLARYLYTLAIEEGVPTDDGGIAVQREISVQDLAALVGSVREVVSRSMKTIEDTGALEIQRKQIVVRDLDLLRKLL